ncbi:ABC transporter permease [Aquibacillus kalidii]|uniref:ABC transporter permease n=1 Tax=Aquibacillus kalidii TaxID=2762597 RepID=UPI001647750A|nr:ABC transporter permease [Aquibacillus kalidii]
MQWRTIFAKEMVEDWRNFKWVWVPLVYIIIAIMDPLTTYYLPKILDAVGGMPEGTIMELPETSPVDAFMMSFTEYSMFGVIVIVTITMGTIAGERKSGVAELVLVKPVGYLTYISSKWGEKLVLILGSYLLGMLASWYYVNLLFGDLAFSEFISATFFYGLWLSLVITITIFCSTLFKSPGIAGFVSIAILIVMSIIYKVFAKYLTWFPNSLSSHIRESLYNGKVDGDLWGTALVTIALIVVLLYGSLFTFRSKEMAS